MSYTKTNWTARIRQYANRMTLTPTGNTNEYDKVQVEGTITIAGTPINPTNLQNMDDQIELLSDEILEDSRSLIQTTQKPVDAFPSGTLESKVLAQIKGRTTVNIFKDDVAGCESTAGWTASNITLATDSANEFEGTNCLKMTLTAASGYIRRDILSKLDITKYYLISAYFKNNDLATGTLIKLDTDDVDVSGSSEDGTTYIRQGIIIQPTDIDTATYAYLTIQEDGASAEYGFADAITLQEISSAEYALGADVVMERYPFHRNVESSIPDFEIVGKNLFDSFNVTKHAKINYTTGAIIDPTSSEFELSDYIQIKPNTDYVINKNINTGTYGHCFFDINKVFISGIAANVPGEITFTTPSNAYYIRTTTNIADHDSLQLEYGTVATDYETHKENTFASGITLRSVPSAQDILYNAVVDADDSTKLLPMDGWTLDTGIDVDTVSDTDYNSHDITTYTNVDVTKTTTTILDIVGTTGVDGATILTDKNGEAMIEVSQANIDLTTSDGKYYVHTDKSIWYITTADTYADIAAARTGIGTTTVQFEKVTPVITQPILDEIWSFVNGTWYQNQTVMAEVDYTVVKNYKTVVDSNTEVIEKLDDEVQFNSKFAGAKIDKIAAQTSAGIISFDSAEFKSHSDIWEDGNPTKFTIPFGYTKAQIILNIIKISQSGTTDETGSVVLNKNSVATDLVYDFRFLDGAGAGKARVSGNFDTGIMNVIAGDYFEIELTDHMETKAKYYVSIQLWR